MLRLFLEERIEGADRQAFARLIIQVWTETLRNEELAKTLAEGYHGMRAAWTELVTAYRASGLLHADVPADHVARTLIAVAQGFVAQQALFGDVAVEILKNKLRGLMSMTVDPVG